MVKPGQTVLIRAVAWDRRAISDWGLELSRRRRPAAGTPSKLSPPEAESAAMRATRRPAAIDCGNCWKSRSPPRLRQCWMHARKLQPPTAPTFARQIDIQKSTVALAGSISSDGSSGNCRQSKGLEWPSFRRHAPGGGPLRWFGRRRPPSSASIECRDHQPGANARGRPDSSSPRRCPGGASRNPTGHSTQEKPVAELIAAQDRIIDVLRKLLDVARQAEAERAGRDEEAARRPTCPTT